MLLGAILLIVHIARAQERFTISGTITAQKTGETIIGATIKAGNTGTTSNEYGFLTHASQRHL